MILLCLQDLLDTIQRLQNQLTALQKAQENKAALSFPSQSSSQSQTLTEGSRKRTEDGLQKSEGASSSAVTGLTSQGKKKGKKQKRQKPFDFTK